MYRVGDHVVIGVVVCWIVARGILCPAEDAQVLDRGTWQVRSTRTVGELKGFLSAGNVNLSQYGGLSEQQVTATGFFRTELIEGRWWLVDPEGHPFISVGLCSVNHSGVDESLVPSKFGDQTGWAKATSKLLKSHRFNTLGCWSDWRSFRPTAARMPYTPRWNFMSTYKNRRPAKNGPRGFPHETMPVFDADFETFCEEHAGQLSVLKDDPWLLGHFSDNELPFRPDPLTNFFALPENDVGYRFARDWLNKRLKDEGRSEGEITSDDQAAFALLVAQRYYSIVAKAIRKYDPNHLYLGSRIHGRCLHETTFRGAAPVDVISVNYYHRWSAKYDRITNWLKWSGRPVLISEWYAQSLASADTEASGAGFRVRSDRDRGLFYQNMTLGLLEHPECVGWHWFKYGGDGEGFHKGIVDRQYNPHTDMLELMGEVNRQVYRLRSRQ